MQKIYGKIFENFRTKISLENCEKGITFDSGTRRKKFRGVQGKGSGLVGGEFSKITKRKFLKKIAKMLYFRLFCKEISKPCGMFSRVRTKNNSLGNFEKILTILEEKSIEKLRFYRFSGKTFLLKIKTSRITSFFCNNYFRFWGRGASLP